MRSSFDRSLVPAKSAFWEWSPIAKMFEMPLCRDFGRNPVLITHCIASSCDRQLEQRSLFVRVSSTFCPHFVRPLVRTRTKHWNDHPRRSPLFEPVSLDETVAFEFLNQLLQPTLAGDTEFLGRL
jgi:hypothetical protein